ncbi:short-chain dehydrogenase [Coniochaeta sp. 2T2.1]|nr:short-chain dehydrogenase [Coniochaeta sp. 2T2.1]
MARLAPYAKEHAVLRGPGDARPTAAQIVKDQGLVASPDWIGRVVLITGCSPGGLGLETAKAIHLTAADVYMTVRDVAKGKQVAAEVLADGMPGRVEVVEVGPGVMFCPHGRTEDGFETHLGVNHLAHFYLFHLVKDALLSSASPSFNSRVVVVASAAHRSGKIHLDDLNLDKMEYDPKLAYGQSKLANIHFANELDRGFKSQNTRALSLHPGGSITPLSRYLGSTKDIEDDPVIGKILMTPAQAAATTVWAAIARQLEGKGGIYLDEVAEAELVGKDAPYAGPGYSARAFDSDTEKRLWTASLKLTGLSDYGV